MAYVVSLTTRERRTQGIRNIAVAVLGGALIAAYLLTFGIPKGLLARPGELVSGPPATAAPAEIAAPATPADDGVISGAVSAFDDTHPAVANLDPVLLGALRAAAVDATSTAGIAVVITSGWRSAQYQDRLLEEAFPGTVPRRRRPAGGHRGDVRPCARGRRRRRAGCRH
ncbi:MAG: hypothetical protein ABS910_07260 [Arthrobacter sp.]